MLALVSLRFVYRLLPDDFNTNLTPIVTEINPKTALYAPDINLQQPKTGP